MPPFTEFPFACKRVSHMSQSKIYRGQARLKKRSWSQDGNSSFCYTKTTIIIIEFFVTQNITVTVLEILSSGLFRTFLKKIFNLYRFYLQALRWKYLYRKKIHLTWHANTRSTPRPGTWGIHGHQNFCRVSYISQFFDFSSRGGPLKNVARGTGDVISCYNRPWVLKRFLICSTFWSMFIDN